MRNKPIDLNKAKHSVSLVIKHPLQFLAVCRVAQSNVEDKFHEPAPRSEEKATFSSLPPFPSSVAQWSSWLAHVIKDPTLDGSRGLFQLLISLTRNTRNLSGNCFIGHLAAVCLSCLCRTLGIAPVLAAGGSEQAAALKLCFCFRH